MAEVNDIIEARVVCSVQQQIGVNVLHFRVTAKAGTGATLTQIAAAIDTKYAAAYKALLSVAASYRGVGARKLLPAPASNEEAAVANAGLGSGTGDLNAKQVSGVLTKKTANAGRRYRGRIYIPFPGEDDNDPAGKPTAGYVARLLALALLLDDDIAAGEGANTNTLRPVVRSRKFALHTDITSVLQKPFWATQRRRGDFGRVNAIPF